MLRALTTWLHEDNPFKLLAFESPLNEIKSRLASDGHYFEKLIKTYLLDNIHRTTLRFKPDPEIGRRFEEEEKARLAAARESMSAHNCRNASRIQRNSSNYRKHQTHPKRWRPCPSFGLQTLKNKVRRFPSRRSRWAMHRCYIMTCSRWHRLP